MCECGYKTFSGAAGNVKKDTGRSQSQGQDRAGKGICESASGQSELSRKGNNHFGIKVITYSDPEIAKIDFRRRGCGDEYKIAKVSINIEQILP